MKNVLLLLWPFFGILIQIIKATGSNPQDEFQSSTSDYAVVIPYLVSEGGEFLSHDVTTSRQKRSTAENANVYLNISGLGQKFHLHLTPNTQLLAPGFKVYHRRRKENEEIETVLHEDPSAIAKCLYTGKTKSHGDEPAAISLCNGVEGIIRTAEEDYIIEPIQRQAIKNYGGVGQPHKLYRRSALRPDKRQYCGKRNPEEIKDIEYWADRKHSEMSLFSNTTHSSHLRERRALYKWHKRPGMKDVQTVETLVVVDKSMYHKHGQDNVTTYALTVFNMVSQLFLDNSIGKQIHIVLVGLILLEGDEVRLWTVLLETAPSGDYVEDHQPGLFIGHHADRTLNSFCSWQSVLVGANGRQHDHAILLTGLDICSYKNAPCDTLGFAPIEGMCNRIRSCTINEDTGLSTAFTIAHEVGHNFGMFHDGEGNLCKQSKGTIMSPILVGKDGLFRWSLCSKAYLLRFLNTPQSQCLTNKPKYVAELKFPEKLPGVLYDADIQCKWQFGKNAKFCSYDLNKDSCKALWCYRGNKRCETKFLPAAEGTSCGHGMWCRQGKCVKYGRVGPKPVNGGWHEWSDWSQCSRTCGKGITHRERECNSPLPQYGGKACLGEEKRHKLCNVKDCPVGDDDMYDLQCATYNKKQFRGWFMHWKPYKRLYDVRDPCKLYCSAETYNYVFTIKHLAVNGMRCSVTGNDVCVDGACQSVGCDWYVGSPMGNDICGVCNGDNSTCKLISGQYTEHPRTNIYFPVAILPKTARNLKIRERKLTSNYLAIRNIYGRYYLNGQRRVVWPGVFRIGGANFIYKRPLDEPETLEAEGPLTEDLVLEILVQEANPGVLYQYTIPKTEEELRLMTPVPPVYGWIKSATACSEPCAGGKQVLYARCYKDQVKEMNPSFCKTSDKPKVGEVSCNTQPCPARWVPEEWRLCSQSCAGGKQLRKIKCRQKHSVKKDKKLKRHHCKMLPKPIRKRRCNQQVCPPKWHGGHWSKCSKQCGKGLKSRDVICRRRGTKGFHVLPHAMCERQLQPLSNKTCMITSCVKRFDWLLSEWGQCSKSCGSGLQNRRVECIRIANDGKTQSARKSRCLNVPLPQGALEEACILAHCPQQRQTSKWYTFPWSKCSVTCGQGIMMRRVECADSAGQSLSLGCNAKTKPSTSQNCYPGTCRDDEPYCRDMFPWCYLVIEHGVCSHKFYGTNCCKTCKGS